MELTDEAAEDAAVRAGGTCLQRGSGGWLFAVKRVPGSAS